MAGKYSLLLNDCTAYGKANLAVLAASAANLLRKEGFKPAYLQEGVAE